MRTASIVPYALHDYYWPAEVPIVDYHWRLMSSQFILVLLHYSDCGVDVTVQIVDQS